MFKYLAELVLFGEVLVKREFDSLSDARKWSLHLAQAMGWAGKFKQVHATWVLINMREGSWERVEYLEAPVEGSKLIHYVTFK